MALITCLECKKKISEKADRCPNCGSENVAFIKWKRKQTNKFLCIVCLTVILVFIIFYNITPDSTQTPNSTKSLDTSDDTFHKKYALVKGLDDEMYKKGYFDKIEMSGTDTVVITLNMRNGVAYGRKLGTATNKSWL